MAEDSGGLGGLLGWFGRPYDPQAAYEGLLSSQATKDALQARSLASIAQAFGAGAGSDARGSAIPFGTTMGNAAAAAYGGQDELIKARNVAAEQMLHQAQASKATAEAAGLPIQFKMMQAFFDQQQKEAAGGKPAPGSPLGLLQQGGGGARAGGGGSVDADPNVSNFNFAGLRNPNEPAAGGPRDNPKGWQTFPTPEAGVAAIDAQVQRYASGATTGKPINTLAGIITTWAPPTDNNDTAGLIARASKITGFAPNQPLDMSDPTTRAKVTEALIRGEHGDVLPSAVTPEVMAKAHGLPAPHTFAPPVAGVADRPVTPTEADIYRKAPFPTVQNAGVVPPPVMTDKLPTGTIAPNPFNTPTGGPSAPPAAPLAPQGAVGGEKLSGLLGTQPDPVTANTMAALRGTTGATPGVNAAAPSPVASLLAPGAVAPGPAAPPGADIRQVLGAAGAPPQVPPQLQSLLAQAGGGAPPIPQGGVPQGPPPVVSGAVGMEKGGGLLNAPPPAPPPVAPPVAPPAAVPPAAAPGGLPPLPTMPTMPPIPTTMPAMPSFTPPAPTTLEGMAQAITGISSLTGHPAPAFMQELAKMPAQKAMEAYKAYVTGQANMLSEQYKKQLEITGAGVISQLQAQGALPSKLTELTTEQNLRLRNALAEKGLVFENGQYRIDPSWLSAEAQRQQQQVDFERRKSLATESTKTDVKNRDQVIDEAKSAQLEQVTLNNMRNNAQNIYTGPYADYKNYLNRILVSTGLDPSRANAVASFEDFTKNSGQLVRQAVQQTSARAAVQEFKLIAGALPTTDTSPLGLQRVLGEYQGLANYRLAKLEAQTAYENRPGSMGAGDTSGFEAAFAKQASPYAFVVDHMSQADRQALFTQVMKQEGGKQELQRLQEQLSYMHGQGWGRTQ